MRTIVSSSLFGFVTVAAVALAGCGFSTEPESAAESPAVGDESDPKPGNGGGESSPSPVTASGATKPELGPSATSAGELVGVELSKPELQLQEGNPKVLVASSGSTTENAPAVEVPGTFTAIGKICSSDAECESGSCADGVCCDTACDGACEACNIPGSVGSCVPHAAGTDPDAECASPACYNGMQETFSCDGAGACQVQIDSCGAFACGGSACLTECRTDADCAEGAHCSGERCVSK